MDRIGRHSLLLGLATIGLIGFAACGGDDSAAPEDDSAGEADRPRNEQASVTAADYSFDGPDTIAAGETKLQFTNDGQENHDLHVMQLKDGVLIHQFAQRLHQEGLDAALELGEERGHVPSIGPGETAEATVDLTEGEYVLICMETSPDDEVAHALKGMFVPLAVTAAP